jgi:anaerobic selenocysteine-containing dehydrogenase
MSPTRREFVWTAGAAGAALALTRVPDVIWTAQSDDEIAWQPGIEDRLTSTCLVCPARCGIRGRVVDGNLVEIGGNPLHPVSRGGVCPRGIAGVQTLYHPGRISSPLERVGPRGSGEWREISREEALSRVSERLGGLREEGRPEKLALVSGYCAGTMSDLWRQFLVAFGTPNRVPEEYHDGTDLVMGLMHGMRRQPGYDLENARFVLSFGAPLFESWWSPLQAYVAFSGRGTGGERPHFVQVDTRFSRTAAGAHEWVGIRPGTHAVLALGIAYVLIRDGLIDERFLDQHVSGFEDFTDQQGRRRTGYRSLVTRNYRSEEVSAVTGVSVERISSLARDFARGGAAVAVCGSDVTQSAHGLLAGLAVHSLNVLVGSVGRAGGVMFGDAPPLGSLPQPVLDATATSGLERERVGSSGVPFGEGDPSLRFARGVVDSSEPTIEALLVYYANPLASSPRPDLWEDAIDRIPFVVSFSPFLDETASLADVILPDLLSYERWQDAPVPRSHPYPVWGIARPLVEPQAGGTHTGDAILSLARSLGGSVAESLPFEGFETVLRVRARGLFVAGRGMTLGDEFGRRHHRQMEQRGWWLPEHGDFDSFWDDLVEKGGWLDLFYDETDPARISQREDGRIALMPEELLEVLEAQGRRDAMYIEVVSPGSEEAPLLLIPYRLSTLSSGTLSLERWLSELPTVLPEVFWEPWVEVNPETAHDLGLDDGDMVHVASERGRYRARLKVFPGTAAGTVCAPYRLRHPDGEGANPLQLLDDSHDPLTGLSSWFSTPIRLERA